MLARVVRRGLTMEKHRLSFGIAVVATLLVAGILSSPETSARDTKNMWPIADAMNAPEAKAQLNQGVQFFFGDSAHPAVEKSFGVFQSNKKTNGVGRSDKEACDWTFVSAMVSFQQRAKQMGGDAVIKIESYYRQETISSATEYQCGSGALMSGVTFRGEVVKLKQ
jgi:hypothetical protein